MVTVLITLSIITLLVTIFDSLKDVWKNQSKYFSYGIISLTLLGFSATIYVVYDQDKESTIAKNKINSIQTSLNDELVKIEAFKRKTDILLDIADSSSQLLSQIISDRESLLSQYKSVNDRLRQQIDVEKKAIKERSPILDAKTSASTITGKDSSEFGIQLLLGNYGGRSVQVKRIRVLALIFNESGKIIMEVPGPHITDIILSPLKDYMYGHLQKVPTYTISEFNKITTRILYATIYCSVDYYDIIDKSLQRREIFQQWDYKQGFGRIEEGQEQKLREWIQNNPNKF